MPSSRAARQARASSATPVNRLGREGLSDDERRPGERRGHVAAAAPRTHHHVVGPAVVQARGVRVEGHLRVDHGGQRIE